MQYAVMIKDLVKTYNGFEALRGVDLQIPDGIIYGLLGPNGAGKSTLISIIVGVSKPDKGDVVVLGGSPSDPRIRSLIGYQPQEHGLHPNLTGWENLYFYAGIYGVGKKEARPKIEELASTLGVLDHLGKPVRTYSGGLKQRLSIIAALLHDPELIVLDEPTTGLDPGVRQKVWDLIRDLRRRGKTILLATHYMEEAEKLGDEVAIIDNGRIIARGSPEELKQRYGPPAVIEIVLGEEGVGDRLAHALASQGIEATVLGRDRLRIYCKDPDAIIPDITGMAYRLGLSIRVLRVVKPSLEDVFLKLTGRRLGENES
ncbi:MAG: ABC transporter ATP-binding protein [Crenarchaeota archaeon]|nr:ABC transporter ATP-binding protein [Thermoproteota archaeon]